MLLIGQKKYQCKENLSAKWRQKEGGSSMFNIDSYRPISCPYYMPYESKMIPKTQFYICVAIDEGLKPHGIKNNLRHSPRCFLAAALYSGALSLFI